MARRRQGGWCGLCRLAATLWLLAASLGSPAARAAAGSCLDPSLLTSVAAPEGALSAAGTSFIWPEGTNLVGPDSQSVQGTTGVGGEFNASAQILPAGSFGFRLQVAFQLDGTQGLAISGARSRLQLPLDLDLPALPPGLSLVADVRLTHMTASVLDSGSVSSTVLVERFGPDHATLNVGPLTTTGSTAGVLSGLTVGGTPEFRVVLDADALVMARGGAVDLDGVLEVIVHSAGDFDGDGLPDLVELDGPDTVPGTGDESDPGRVDADGDGETDASEIARGGAAFDPCDVDLGAATTGCLRVVGDLVSWWPLSTCADPPFYHLYRGRLDVLRAGGDYTQEVDGPDATGERFCGLTGTSQIDTAATAPGEPLFWLVSGEVGGVELTLGESSGGTRPNAHPCP